MINTNKKTLFSAGNTHGNVVLNFRGDSVSEFGYYAESFHEAAKYLVDKVEASHGYSDLDACPIVFMYRHSLELYLKAIVIVGNKISRLKSKKAINEKSFMIHEISKLFPIVQKVFKEVGWEWEEGLGGFEGFQELKGFVDEMESVDPSSFTFRYPANKSGAASVKKNFCFNVIDYAEKMNILLDDLDGVVAGLDSMATDLIEFQATSQNDNR
jgi:hypothetical protein